ncbi:hypothetical protein ACFFLM_04380 [Deinococcus oregonensis]|uniref:Tip attachment protein J domain-containing protein n=1 Tax=Deinococcus oregonensis TaxID=1805970 RepID=A0ABV6AUN9_9DEIO
MIRNVRLTVRDWDGTLRHERYLKHADPALQMDVPADGFEAGRTGYAGCLELTFQAIWATLGAQERDLLELDTLDELGVWHREYAGVVVKSGNSQLTRRHSNFKATGLKKRTTEVRLVADVPEGDAGAQLRAALQAVIASNQLGSAIVYDPAAIPDTGVIVGKFPARGRKLSDLCDYLAGQAGRVWDVDADRKLFLRPTSLTAITLTEGIDVRPTYEDTDSEALVTRVMFNLGTVEGEPYLYAVDSPDLSSFGTSVKDVLFSSSQAWALQAFTTALISGGIEGVTLPELAAGGTGRDEDPVLNEYGVPIVVNIFSITTGETVAYPVVEFTLTQATRRIWIDLYTAGVYRTEPPPALGDNLAEIQVTLPEFAGYPNITLNSRNGQDVRFTQHLYPLPGNAEFPAGTKVKLVGLKNNLVLYGFRPEQLNMAVLGPLAAFHFVTPRRDPATITARGRVTPQPMLNLMRADGSTYETTTESVTLHLKLNALGVSVIKAGQREPAEDRAARWLGQVALADAVQDSVLFKAGQ